jgi:hypothetical protein
VSDYSLYLDVAGHVNDQPYLCLGGFLATDEQWTWFDAEWVACLNRWKIDTPFHAKQFFFENKRNPRKDHIVRDLVRVICNHVRAAFSATIDIHAYRQVNEQYLFEECIGTPYATLTRSLLHSLEEWKTIVGFTESISLFVESGTLHEGDMQQCLRDRDGLPEPVSVPKSHPACQAADLYSYLVFQVFKTDNQNNLVRLFAQKLALPKERRDGVISAMDLARFLREGRIIFTDNTDGLHHLMRVPLRSEAEGRDFNFPGSRKVKRVRRIK